MTFVSLSVRKAIVLAIMMLVLLAGLVAWTMRMEVVPAMFHQTGIHGVLKVGGPNIVCPAPPYECD